MVRARAVGQPYALSFMQNGMTTLTLASDNALLDAYRPRVFARWHARASTFGLDLSARAMLLNRKTLFTIMIQIDECFSVN